MADSDRALVIDALRIPYSVSQERLVCMNVLQHRVAYAKLVFKLEVGALKSACFAVLQWLSAQ